jgi:putative ABC transport system permease protein
MEWSERLRMAREGLGDHPGRAVASSLGVFWGAAAIVVLLAWGAGFRVYMKHELSSFGRGCVIMLPGITSSGFPGYRAGVWVRIGREETARAEAAAGDRVDAVLPIQWSRERAVVEAEGRYRRLDVNGVDARYPAYRGFEVAHGRFFSPDEVAKRRTVAVLGPTAARSLFGDPAAAVGRSVRVDGRSFEVVGVTDDKGRQYLETRRPDDRLVLVPITTGEDRLGFDEERLSRILVYPRPGVDAADALRATLEALGPLAGFHPDDADAVRTYDVTEFLGLVDLFYAGFMIFVGVAGTVTLVIGGVGIANYHLAILAERTVEIAVAKAVGARERTLAVQTVLEALLVAGTAAAAGVLLGLVICWALTTLPPPDTVPPPLVSPLALGVTFLALLAVSVTASVIPALRVRATPVAAALRA